MTAFTFVVGALLFGPLDIISAPQHPPATAIQTSAPSATPPAAVDSDGLRQLLTLRRGMWTGSPAERPPRNCAI
jgi:hypothetical protein